MMVVVITILSGSLRINDLTNIKLLEHCLEHGKGGNSYDDEIEEELVLFCHGNNEEGMPHHSPG